MSSRFGRMHTVGLVAALIAGGMLGGAETANAQPASLQVLKTRLLEFEANVRWTMEGSTERAVEVAFEARRTAWRTEVGGARNANAIATLLREFEVQMTWASVNGSWSGARDQWVSTLTSAQTEAQVATGMLILENATKWEAVLPAWRSLRAPWRSALEGIGGRDSW
jgi:hypothetical protein